MIYSCLARWYEDPFQPVVVACRRPLFYNARTTTADIMTRSSLVFLFLAHFLPECLFARLTVRVIDNLSRDLRLRPIHPSFASGPLFHGNFCQIVVATFTFLVDLLWWTMERITNDPASSRSTDSSTYHRYGFVYSDEHRTICSNENDVRGFSNKDLRVDYELDTFDYLSLILGKKGSG